MLTTGADRTAGVAPVRTGPTFGDGLVQPRATRGGEAFGNPVSRRTPHQDPARRPVAPTGEQTVREE